MRTANTLVKRKRKHILGHLNHRVRQLDQVLEDLRVQIRVCYFVYISQRAQHPLPQDYSHIR